MNFTSNGVGREQASALPSKIEFVGIRTPLSYLYTRDAENAVVVN